MSFARHSLLLLGTCAILGALATVELPWNDREPALVAAGAIPSGVAAGLSLINPLGAGVIATAGVLIGFAVVAELRPDPGSENYPLGLNLLWVALWVLPVALVLGVVGRWLNRSSRVA